MEINIHDAKTHFSKLLERAEQGEDVIIARAGKPIVKLVYLYPAENKRVLGAARGTVAFEPGWNDLMNEEELGEWGA